VVGWVVRAGHERVDSESTKGLSSEGVVGQDRVECRVWSCGLPTSFREGEPAWCEGLCREGFAFLVLLRCERVSFF
jgi:hypothetical protein